MNKLNYEYFLFWLEVFNPSRPQGLTRPAATWIHVYADIGPISDRPSASRSRPETFTGTGGLTSCWTERLSLSNPHGLSQINWRSNKLDYRALIWRKNRKWQIYEAPDWLFSGNVKLKLHVNKNRKKKIQIIK